MRTFLIATLAATFLCTAQVRADDAVPAFDDYKVTDSFAGKPAKVRIVSAQDRKFATRLRELSGQKPNFAGHYSLVNWGCGASCVMTAAIDAKNGHVTWLPFTVCCWDVDVTEPIDFKPDSRLIVVHGSRNEEGGGVYYYQLQPSGFTLVKAVEKSK
jgi:hypothetical protein